MSMKTGHLSVRQGKRVVIHFRDATKKVAKFKERGSNYVEFYELGRIPTVEIRTLSIAKGVI